ncbi:MAG: FAD-dependent oxidoreductase [Hyphomonadaceae bacterium JAD_PAG50586_4]|nr:MAG: FAD-dependent oxidoreductase [Hyphomonadaceae bacterium JAD_PAG50586_4]
MANAHKIRVAIVGGGYGGYALAIRLDPHVDVILIDAREAFVHNVAAIRAIVNPTLTRQIVIPYDRLLKRGRFVCGRVTEIHEGGVRLADGPAIEADIVVAATGSHYAAPFKPQGDSVADFSARLAEVSAQVKAADHVVIVGAGAVGVELAGEIKAVYADKHVALLSSADRLFPSYPAKLHAGLVRRLKALGVDLHLGDGAKSLEATDRPWAGDVTLESGARLSGLIFPAIGTRIAESPVHALPGVTRRQNGQVEVDAWLRPSRLPNVFALGDIAETGDAMTVVGTTRQAPWLAKTLRQIASGKRVAKLKRYTPWPVPPILLPLGSGRGVSVLPLGKSGMVVGDGMTSSLKGKTLFIPRYHEEFGRA